MRNSQLSNHLVISQQVKLISFRGREMIHWKIFNICCIQCLNFRRISRLLSHLCYGKILTYIRNFLFLALDCQIDCIMYNYYWVLIGTKSIQSCKTNIILLSYFRISNHCIDHHTGLILSQNKVNFKGISMS